MSKEIDKLIRDSVLKLLEHKDYKEIQMQEIAAKANIARRTLYRYYSHKDAIVTGIVTELMDDFADTINQVHRMDLEGIAYAFFLFWENNLDELRLLKKAHLMYLLEDNLEDLIREVSFKTKFKDMSREEWQEVMDSWTPEDTYAYHYMLAGYFKVAKVWMEEENRRSPEEMAVIIRKIVLREV